ncbi:uncharacterized protein VP01_3438g1 [Puccinia sorghi]|uniref:Retrovirus-related Pol polyprotein from transposon TNT 1-94-like beta-barrel domain-containing protein n=1 Tax=Puccinia sorghi TaxID=27349 RepID=A0A0L6UWB5_9BASI|nr:uncharacterized protein VP01_3438g1 [Puccinia sorghi]
MFSDKSKSHQYKSRSTLIELADGNTLESVGEGFVHLASKNGAIIELKALHVPDLAGTLISFGRLFAKGCNVVRTGESTFDMVNKGSILLSAEVVGGTYNVKLAEIPEGERSHRPPLAVISTTSKSPTITLSSNMCIYSPLNHKPLSISCNTIMK